MSNVLSVVTEELEAWFKPQLVGSRVFVPTLSTYPSNAVVYVTIEGGNDVFVVSDGAGAVETLHGAGGHKVAAHKLLQVLLRGQGNLRVDKSGAIYTSPVRRSELTAAISLIAETSVRCSEILLRNFKPERHSDFRKEIGDKLQVQFRDAFKAGGHMPGASTKVHKFDFLIRRPSGTMIVMDAVVPDSSSVNAALVSHLDLKRAKRADVQQAIIYDDTQDWRSSDLALLTIAAPPIAYSHWADFAEKLEN
ncbi:DUF1829 domain-containing protein [Bradyrhizobium sp. USDA 4504]